MAHQGKSIRQEQISRLLQKTLSMMLISDLPLLSHQIVSISMVHVNKSGTHAKIYLSCSLEEDPKPVLAFFLQKRRYIRYLLGQKLSGKMQNIPQLSFYIDHRITKMERTLHLIEQIG